MKLLIFAALLATAYGTLITAPVSYGNNLGYSGGLNSAVQYAVPQVVPQVYSGYGLQRSLYSVPVYQTYQSNLGYRNLGYQDTINYGVNNFNGWAGYGGYAGLGGYGYGGYRGLNQWK